MSEKIELDEKALGEAWEVWRVYGGNHRQSLKQAITAYLAATAQQSAKADLGEWVTIPHSGTPEMREAAMGEMKAVDGCVNVAALHGMPLRYRADGTPPLWAAIDAYISAAPSHLASESAKALVEAARKLQADIDAMLAKTAHDFKRPHPLQEIIEASNSLNAALAPFQPREKSE